jgi:hypothetical protein
MNQYITRDVYENAEKTMITYTEKDDGKQLLYYLSEMEHRYEKACQEVREHNILICNMVGRYLAFYLGDKYPKINIDFFVYKTGSQIDVNMNIPTDFLNQRWDVLNILGIVERKYHVRVSWIRTDMATGTHHYLLKTEIPGVFNNDIIIKNPLKD